MVLWRHDRIGAGGLARFARAAESAGLGALWIPETWVRDASVQLTLAAEATERIRLAAGIFNIYSRSPGQLAQVASELDVLSGGRFTLGIGVSGRAVIENWHSREFGRPLQMTREVIAVLRMSLAGERVNFEGEVISMSGFRLRRPPVQKRVPIFLAANGPANTRLAGELADGWLPFFVPQSRFAEALAGLEEGARSAGRPASGVEAAPFVLFSPDEDTDRARNRVKPIVAYYVGAMGNYYHAQLSRWGWGADADRIREAWARGGSAAATREVGDPLVDDLALCGPPARCAKALERFFEAGATHPVLRLPDEMSEEEAIGALEILGEIL